MGQWALGAHKTVIDASSLYSACISSTGASRELYRLAGEGKVIFVMCDYTLEEVRDSLKENNQYKALDWFNISIGSLNYQHVQNPTHEDIKNNLELVPKDRNDVPYAVLAIQHDVDSLVSFDKHLLCLNELSNGRNKIPILRPSECLSIIRQSF